MASFLVSRNSHFLFNISYCSFFSSRTSSFLQKNPYHQILHFSKQKSILSCGPLNALYPQKPNDDQPRIHHSVASQTSAIVLSLKKSMVLHVPSAWITYETSGSSVLDEVPIFQSLHTVQFTWVKSSHSEVLSQSKVRNFCFQKQHEVRMSWIREFSVRFYLWVMSKATFIKTYRHGS